MPKIIDIDEDKVKRRQKLPIPVNRCLQKLGQDIQIARRKRRISTAIMAERASISRMTLHKLERGDPGVSLGIVATVLFILGMIKDLSMLVDASRDPVGNDLFEEDRLPKRIRRTQFIVAPKPQAIEKE